MSMDKSAEKENGEDASYLIPSPHHVGSAHMAATYEASELTADATNADVRAAGPM